MYPYGVLLTPSSKPHYFVLPISFSTVYFKSKCQTRAFNRQTLNDVDKHHMAMTDPTGESRISSKNPMNGGWCCYLTPYPQFHFRLKILARHNCGCTEIGYV